MKIKITTGCAGTDYSYSAGQVDNDCPDDRAKDLIKAGYAIELDGKAEKIETAAAKMPKAEKRTKK